MISHEERMQLAEIICARMVTRHPDDVIVVGVYGSTALGTSTPWSDLEMLFVAKAGSQVQKKRFIYRDIWVSISVKNRDKLEQALTSSPSTWLYYMTILSQLNLVHGQSKQIEAWLELGQLMPAGILRAWVQERVGSLLTEPYGRIFSCRERQNTREVGLVVWELLQGIHIVICMLNKRWVSRPNYLGLTDSFGFPKLPEGYSDIVPRITSSHDVNEIASLAETLVLNFWRLLDEEGITLPTVYQNLSDLPI
jgi:kanamycin nucleotidyltransferase